MKNLDWPFKNLQSEENFKNNFESQIYGDHSLKSDWLNAKNKIFLQEPSKCLDLEITNFAHSFEIKISRKTKN